VVLSLGSVTGTTHSPCLAKTKSIKSSCETFYDFMTLYENY